MKSKIVIVKLGYERMETELLYLTESAPFAKRSRGNVYGIEQWHGRRGNLPAATLVFTFAFLFALRRRGVIFWKGIDQKAVGRCDD